MKLHSDSAHARRAAVLGLMGWGFAVAAMPAAAQEPQAEQQVTLDQAVEMAIRNSPDMAAAEGAIDEAEWSQRAAWAQYLPSLSFSSGGGLSAAQRFDDVRNEVVSGASNESFSAGLSSSVDLFTGGSRGAQRDQARAESLSADAGLVEQRFNVAMLAKIAFFDVLRNDELVGLAEAQVERAQEVLEAAERRMEVGSATRSDVLQAQLELSQARQALLQAQHDNRVALLALGRTVGIDGPVRAQLTEPLDPAPLSVSEEELHQFVLASAPAVRSAEATLRLNQAGYRSARSAYLPTLSLGSGYRWNNQVFGFDGGTRSWNLGLNLSFPIFNRFQREQTADQSRTQVTMAEITLRDTQRMVRNELDRVLGALRLAEQQLELSQEALEVAREDLRVQQERYRLGVSTILEQITSQINLAEAEQNVISARYDYQIAKAELEALAGRDL